MDLDDLMAEGKSDANGTFYLSGTETELTTIDPKLNIYHNCNDERKVGEICYSLFSFLFIRLLNFYFWTIV